MRTKDGRELANALNIIFVELPKAKGLEDSVETNTALENWAIFLKEADNPKKADVIRKLTDKEAGLMNAQKSLSSISASVFWDSMPAGSFKNKKRAVALFSHVNYLYSGGI